MPLEYRMVRADENILGIMNIMQEKLERLEPETLDNYIKENPDDIKGYLVKSLILQNTNRQDAFNTLSIALEKFGDNDLLYHAEGVLHEQSNNRDSAISSFKKALGINPINLEARMSLATLLNRAGKHEEAKKLWLQIIELDPELHMAWCGMSRSEYNMQDYERALKHINAALFTLPDKHNCAAERAAYLTNRARVYLKMKNLSGALSDYEQACKNNPKDALDNLASLIQDVTKEKNLEQAKALTEKLLELSPDGNNDLSWYLGLAGLYAITYEESKISPLFSRARKAGMDEVQALEYEGTALMHCNSKKYLRKAINVYEKLIQLTGAIEYGINIIQAAAAAGEKELADKYRRKIIADKQMVRTLFMRFGPNVMAILEGK